MENDLHQLYGIDLWDPATLDRPWPWLKARVEGLMSTNSRLFRATAPKKPTTRHGG